MSSLTARTCQSIDKETPPLSGDKLIDMLNQVQEGWQIVDEKRLERTFTFPNFKKALAFTNKVGDVAEEHNHHPDIFLTWGKVKIALWTHTVDGLSDNDFIVAAHIDAIKR